MKKYTAIIFLLIFTACNIAVCYGVYKKGVETSITFCEEDETQHEILEIKKILKTEESPFDVFGQIIYKTELNDNYILHSYEEVHLSSLETPPDFTI